MIDEAKKPVINMYKKSCTRESLQTLVLSFTFLKKIYAHNCTYFFMNLYYNYNILMFKASVSVHYNLC